MKAACLRKTRMIASEQIIRPPFQGNNRALYLSLIAKLVGRGVRKRCRYTTGETQPRLRGSNLSNELLLCSLRMRDEN